MVVLSVCLSVGRDTCSSRLVNVFWLSSRRHVSCNDGTCKLTYWGRATHICVSRLTIIGPDNGLSPGRRQAITWTHDGILLTGPLGTNLSEILSKIHTFSFKKMHLKTSSVKWRPFWLGLNVLMITSGITWQRGQWRSVYLTHWDRENGRHLPDDIFKCIFLNKNVWI